MAHIVSLPKQGLQMTEGTIIQWFVKEGGEVKAGQPLFSMETDKLVIDIDSEYDGVLLKILAKEDTAVPITTPIAVIGEAGEDMPPVPGIIGGIYRTEETKKIAADGKKDNIGETPKKTSGERIFITPRARKTAAGLSVDYTAVAGSGPSGLIIERDIREYSAMTGKKEAVTPVISGYMASFAYQQIRADMTGAQQFLEKAEHAGVGMELNALVAKAVSAALGKCPEFDASIANSGGRLAVSEGTDADTFIDALMPGDTAALAWGKISELPEGGKNISFMSFSLTYDRRYVDNAQAGCFLDRIKIVMQDPYLAFI